MIKNIKYAFLTVLSSLLLSGCVWQSADMTDITKAMQFCQNKGGLREIDIVFSGSEVAFCLNGERINLSKYRLQLHNKGGTDEKEVQDLLQ